MARQQTSPVVFGRSVRPEDNIAMTSGYAGVVNIVDYFPLLPGDGCAGRFGVDIKLAQMPKPLQSGTSANIQAWFVPKSAFPQFTSREELMAAMAGETIKALGQADRTPPPYFSVISKGANAATAADSAMFKQLGLHIPNDPDGGKVAINSDLIDAYNLVWNFRAAAHSSKITRRKYAAEDLAASTSLARAFWPSARMAHIVPDYDRALVVGSFDLDVAAGALTLSSSTVPVLLKEGAGGHVGILRKKADGTAAPAGSLSIGSGGGMTASGTGSPPVYFDPQDSLYANLDDLLIENSGGAGIPVTLQSIDKARTTQSFARLRTAYAGNDATGFDNDSAIVALLMQGINVPQDAFKRPWLLDSQRVKIGLIERPATDGANLDKSVSEGRASVQLSCNVPVQDVGGIVIVTVEVMPERIDERQSDPHIMATTFDDLPNALRDIQREEPVDIVPNHRIDAGHTAPRGLYGYEPMNYKWKRNFTRLGGAFYQATPGAGFTENRANIWQTEIVDPSLNDLHWLAPEDFPHSVFSDEDAPAFEAKVRHIIAVNGLVQIGDVLAEDNGEMAAVEASGT